MPFTHMIAGGLSGLVAGGLALAAAQGMVWGLLASGVIALAAGVLAFGGRSPR